MSDLTITESTQQAGAHDVCVLKVGGHLDGHTYPEFEAKLNEIVESDRYSIVIDFEQLSYISSAGLGALLNAHSRAREHDGDVRISCLNHKTRRLFDLLGFSHVLDVFDTTQEAMEAFSADAPSV